MNFLVAYISPQHLVSLVAVIVFFAFILVPALNDHTFAAGTTYYVDAQTGNDNNNGTSMSTPWRSIGKINSRTFAPGDNILFKRGQTFTGTLGLTSSGSSGSPITVGAYGTGERPILNGGGSTSSVISGFDKRWVTLRDLQLRNVRAVDGDASSGRAVFIERGSNWTISNLDIKDTCGGIWVWGGTDTVTISDTWVHNGCGEAYRTYGAANFKLHHSRSDTVSGQHSDNVQLYDTHNYEISCNYFDMTGSDSGKGNIISHDATGTAIVRGNKAIAGNYGIGVADSNLTIENNHFVNNRSSYAWSSAIKITGNSDPTGMGPDSPVRNVTIQNNLIDNANLGIYIYGEADKDNFQIRRNTIRNTATPLLWETTFTASDVSNSGAGPSSDPTCSQNAGTETSSSPATPTPPPPSLTCTLNYDETKLVPSGWGAAFNVWSAGPQLLMKTNCENKVEIGWPGNDLQYWYKHGYVYLNNAWQPITFTGPFPKGDWLAETGEAVLPSGIKSTDLNYFVAYMCMWDQNQWKCGCRDRSCTTSQWQLQSFRMQ